MRQSSQLGEKIEKKEEHDTPCSSFFSIYFLYCSGTCPSTKPSFTMPRLTRYSRNFNSGSGASEGGGPSKNKGVAFSEVSSAIGEESMGGVVGKSVGGCGGSTFSMEVESPEQHALAIHLWLRDLSGSFHLVQQCEEQYQNEE